MAWGCSLSKRLNSVSATGRAGIELHSSLTGGSTREASQVPRRTTDSQPNDRVASTMASLTHECPNVTVRLTLEWPVQRTSPSQIQK